MTLSFGTFLTGPVQAWSKLSLRLWRRNGDLPEAHGADVPDYLRWDLGLPPPEAPPFPAPYKVTFF